MITYPLYSNYLKKFDSKNLIQSLISWRAFDHDSIENSFKQALTLYVLICMYESNYDTRNYAVQLLEGILKEYVAGSNDPMTLAQGLEIINAIADKVNNLYQYQNGLKINTSAKQNTIERFSGYYQDELSSKRVLNNFNIVYSRFRLSHIAATYISDLIDSMDVNTWECSLQNFGKCLSPLTYHLCTLLDTYKIDIAKKPAFMIEIIAYTYRTVIDICITLMRTKLKGSDNEDFDEYAISNGIYSTVVPIVLAYIFDKVANEDYVGDKEVLLKSILENIYQSKFIYPECNKNDGITNECLLRGLTIEGQTDVINRLNKIKHTGWSGNDFYNSSADCACGYFLKKILLGTFSAEEYNLFFTHIPFNDNGMIVFLSYLCTYMYLIRENTNDGVESVSSIITKALTANKNTVSRLTNLRYYRTDLKMYLGCININKAELDQDKVAELDKSLNVVLSRINTILDTRRERERNTRPEVVRSEEALLDSLMLCDVIQECDSINAFKPKTINEEAIKSNMEFAPFLMYYSSKYPKVLNNAQVRNIVQDRYNETSKLAYHDGVTPKYVVESQELDSILKTYNEDIEVTFEDESVKDLYNNLYSFKEDTALLNKIIAYLENDYEYDYDDDDNDTKKEDKKPSEEQIKKTKSTFSKIKDTLIERANKACEKLGKGFDKAKSMFDTNAPKIVDSIMSVATLGNKAKEAYIRTKVLPKINMLFKILIVGYGITHFPFFTILALVVKVASDPNASEKSRQLVKDELEAEHHVITRKLSDAESSKNYDAEKKLLVLKKNYEREIAKITNSSKKYNECNVLLDM